MNAKSKTADRLADFRTDKRVLLLSLLALPIGALGAVVAKALLWLIAVLTNAAFFHRFSAANVSLQEQHLGFGVIVVPVLGAFLIGLMARFGSEKIRGHGIPEALEAILLGRSLIEPKVAVLKPVSSAISIGTGGPFGAEGPIIMTGGAFGSIFAQLFHLSAAERKVLLVAGAASGMAAVFATPIAAVLLAVELLLFEWKPRSFIPVALAALVGAVLRVPLLGRGPVFPVTPHGALGIEPLLVSAGIGLATGFCSGGLTALVYAFEDWFERLPIHWMWWPALGAAGVGLGGSIDPRVLGVGYETIHALLQGKILGLSLIMLLFTKAIIWSLSLGSGTSGGVLAPLLMMGGAVGTLVGGFFPVGDPALSALVGMASMMAGTMRSPLTGIIFALELTQDLHALPALLLGCVLSLGVTVLLLRRSILTEKLARRGQHIVREYSVDLFELMRVGEVMDTQVPTVSAESTVAQLSHRIAQGDPEVSRRQGTLIVDQEKKVVGMITRGDIVRALQHPTKASMSVLEAGQRKLIVSYPDEPLVEAIDKMLRHNVGRLPVLERNNSGRAIGYLGRASILAARHRWREDEESRARGPILENLPPGLAPLRKA